MILKQLKVNSGAICEPTNCYIVQDEKTKETMVIDPGGEVNKIIEMLKAGVEICKICELIDVNMDNDDIFLDVCDVLIREKSTRNE